MRLIVALLFSLLLLSAPGAAQSLPMYWLPPDKDAAELETPALAAEQVQYYLSRTWPRLMTSPSEDDFDAVRTEESGGALQIGVGFDIEAEAEDVFGPVFRDGNAWAWLGAVESTGAQGLRLQVDLGLFLETEALWVLDPATGEAFGPFSAADQPGEELWLPSLLGDTAVLLLHSESTSLPPLYLARGSHFFDAPHTKNLPCPIPAECETDPDFRQAMTAVGRLVITTRTGSTILCTGSLINNEAVPRQPYLIGAQHCFRNTTDTPAMEVIWDYRAVGCEDAVDLGPAGFPRTQGAEILVSNSTLDAILLRLTGTVPSGEHGRAWLGWTLRRPAVGNDAVAIHHPRGTALKLAYGRVTALNVVEGHMRRQTEILWDQGITEGGSSGSPALFADSAQLFGMLSNGTVHSCVNTSNNFDNYATFREFHPEIASLLEGGAPPPPGNGTDGCAARAAFGENGAELEDLRVFRDRVLGASAWGKELTALYYERAPAVAAAVRESEEARAAFQALAAPFVLWGRLLD